MILKEIPLHWMNYYLGWPKTKPINLTVSVTYGCNSRCLTCNIWKKKAEEFTQVEFEETFKTIGKPYWVTISGGEPFMRNDLVDIVKSLYNNAGPKIINIPTNGTIQDIPERVEDIVNACKNSKVVVNLSLDGIGKKHDEIRNLKGCFEKAMKTYEALRGIKQKNFTLGIHTVISRYNVKDIAEIFSYVRKLKPDSYITEIAEERIELGTMNASISPSIEDYSNAVNFLSSKMREEKFSGLPRITQAFRLEYYKLVQKNLVEKRQIIPCYAGFASGQIAPDGDVWSCCIRAEPVGNLRESDYDFGKVWFSKRADIVRQTIKKGGCHCPLANTSYTNMLFNPATLLKVLKGVVL